MSSRASQSSLHPGCWSGGFPATPQHLAAFCLQQPGMSRSKRAGELSAPQHQLTLLLLLPFIQGKKHPPYTLCSDRNTELWWAGCQVQKACSSFVLAPVSTVCSALSCRRLCSCCGGMLEVPGVSCLLPPLNAAAPQRGGTCQSAWSLQ